MRLLPPPALAAEMVFDFPNPAQSQAHPTPAPSLHLRKPYLGRFQSIWQIPATLVCEIEEVPSVHPRRRGRLREGTIHWKTRGACVLARHTLLIHSWYMLRDTCILLNLDTLFKDGVIHPSPRDPCLEVSFYPWRETDKVSVSSPLHCCNVSTPQVCFGTKILLQLRGCLGKPPSLLSAGWVTPSPSQLHTPVVSELTAITIY